LLLPACLPSYRWCGHCKSLAPRYEKLGELFAKEPSVVIAKVDATENDTPAQVQGYPTILFYPAGAKKNPITFNGDRTEEGMSDFIYKHGNTLKGHTSAAKTASGHEDL
jgi:protein disulfide-isomerase A1